MPSTGFAIGAAALDPLFIIHLPCYAAPPIEASSCAISGLGPAAGASPLCCCSVGCEAGTGAVPTAGILDCSGSAGAVGATGCGSGANAFSIIVSNWKPFYLPCITSAILVMI